MTNTDDEKIFYQGEVRDLSEVNRMLALWLGDKARGRLLRIELP
jgi:hypothetical protein